MVQINIISIPISEGICKDEKDRIRCRKVKNRGCNNEQGRNGCQKTCGLCVPGTNFLAFSSIHITKFVLYQCILSYKLLFGLVS